MSTANAFVAPAEGQQTGRKANKYWYRENASYLYQVTSAPTNMMLGIEDISLKPASENQKEYGIIANGSLRTVVATITFQLIADKQGYPYVSTISTPYGPEDNKQYWDHIILRPQVKAQILRFFDVLTGAAPVQQQTQPWMQQQPQNNNTGWGTQAPAGNNGFGSFGNQKPAYTPQQTQKIEDPNFGDADLVDASSDENFPY